MLFCLLFVLILEIPVITYRVSECQSVPSDICLLGLDFPAAFPRTWQLAARLSEFRDSISVAAKYKEQRMVQALISHYISIR